MIGIGQESIQPARIFLCIALLFGSSVPQMTFAQAKKSVSAASPASGVHRPETILRSGNTGSIQALAVSADGHWMASGGYDKTVVLWNHITGEQDTTFSGHTAAIIRLAFSPDGSQLASTSFDGTVRIWDVGKRRSLYSMKLGGLARCLQYTADGKLWAVSANAKRESETARIELHDAVSGSMVRTIPTDWSLITAMTITADGRLIAAGLLSEEHFAPGSVHIWNLVTGEMQKSYPVSADAFSPDGHWMGWINYSQSPNRVVITDLATGREKQNLALGNNQAIYFSPDGEQFAMTDPISSKLKLWSIATGEVRTFGVESFPGSTGLNALAFSADGKSLVAAPYADHSIKMWEVASGQERRTSYGQGIVQGMVLSRDGSQLIAGSPHGLDFWDLSSGKRTNIAAIGYVNAFAISPDGRWLAANPGARFSGEKMAVWDINSHTVVAEFSFDRGGSPVSSVAFVSNDSPLKQLGPLSRSFEFTADDGKHTIWSNSFVASSPDGRFMAIQTGMGGSVVIWDMTSGQKVATLEAHNLSLSTLAFSLDGRSLVTAGAETQPVGTRFSPGGDSAEWGVKVWDAKTWKLRVARSFSRSGAPCAAFSQDSRRIAIEKAWDVVEILDAENGAPLEVLHAKDPNPSYHQFAPNNVMFSTDGKRLFQGAQNGIRVWKLSQP